MATNLRKRKVVDYVGDEIQSAILPEQKDVDMSDGEYFETGSNTEPRLKRVRMTKRPKKTLKTEHPAGHEVNVDRRPTSSTNKLRPFKFLDLPAELRNKIYAYLVEDSKNDPPPRIIRSPKNATVYDPRCPPPQRNALKNHRYCNFGLAQTARQIRCEFNPLIQAVQPRVIHMADVPTYLNLTPDSSESRNGNLVIDTYLDSSSGIDILPLIRLLDRSPDLHLTLLTEPPKKGS